MASLLGCVEGTADSVPIMKRGRPGRPSMCVLMQDYDKTPIGFGIVVFCIAKVPKL